MNETKSAKYHRLKRRAGAASLIGTAILLAALLRARPSLPLIPYILMLVALHQIVALPAAFYRGFLLERRYELSSERPAAWLRGYMKVVALATVLVVLAGAFVQVLIAWSAEWWWVAAAVAGTGVTALLVALAPVMLLPLFYRFTPLDRPSLSGRLVSLSNRAGVPVLGVFEWQLGAKTRRANAALVGSGATRRILLSDTLLAEYSDDEIEVILAHELAHHVHRDMSKGMALELGLQLAACFAAAAALDAWSTPLGLSSHTDPAGFPLLLLAYGAVMLGATPLANALSRFNERRADEFALALTQRQDAFVSVMRRLGAQNLAEESPSRTAVWLFHTHPPIDERIAAARTSAG